MHVVIDSVWIQTGKAWIVTPPEPTLDSLPKLGQ